LCKFKQWGKVLSIRSKEQQKYQTVRLKIILNEVYRENWISGKWAVFLDELLVRWYSAHWNLSERKERERFQAVLFDIPESMMEQSLASLSNINNVLQGARAKSFKIIKDENGKRKLIVYLESWDALNLLLGSHVVWGKSKLDWCRHSSVSKHRSTQRNKKAINNKNKHSTVIKDQKESRE